MFTAKRKRTMLWIIAFIFVFGTFVPGSGTIADTPTNIENPIILVEDNQNGEEVPGDANELTPTLPLLNPDDETVGVDDLGDDDGTVTPTDPVEEEDDGGDEELTPTATPAPPTEEQVGDGDKEIDEDESITATPTSIDATVEVEGVDEGGIIDPSAGVQITITLPSIPVEGDGGDDFFVWGDQVTLLISEYFMFDDPLPVDQDLLFNGIKVGTVKYSNVDGHAVATIVFDGEQYIFDPELMPPGEPPYAGVSAEFTCDLIYNNEYLEDENGDEYVIILDKTYYLQLPGDIHTYAVNKEVGLVNLDEGTITWSVTITGESDTVPPTPLDLAGFLFEDNLTAVGTYVPDSFLVNGVSATPGLANQELTYTLPSPSVSPIVITFKTVISDAVLTNGGTITNQAYVYDGTDEIGNDSDSTTIVGPSASKTGTADDGFGGDGSYDPNDRTITWTITVDNEGQTLNGLTITDVLQDGLTFESAVWQKWDEATSTWVDVPGKSWATEPTGGIYEIGDVDYIGRLVIVSNVPDEDDGSVSYRTYNNQATANWISPGGTAGSAGTGNIGVGIGYDAITKSGTQSDADKANHQITWTINVDLMGQSPTDFVYYDLFVHSSATTNAALMGAAGWPAGISIGNPGISRNNGQKYVSHTADGHLSVEAINLAGLGTLVKVSQLRATGTNQVVIKSQVIDPDILAGNKSDQSVPNVASLYKGTTYRSRDNASVPFNNMVLAKQMLNRAEVANDHDPSADINPNNSTTNAANGFHYDYREVIFRLNINAAGLDFADVETNLPGGFGDVTITDTLPAGWVFSPFSGGAAFLIYDANSAAVATVPALDPTTIAGFTYSVGTSTATFAFTNLDQPYVILVKAKPTDETFDGYLVGANSHVETNTVNLKSANWGTGVSDSQNVRVDTEIIDKSIDASQQFSGILTWLLDYTPLNRPIADGFQDTLPEGIDLRLDSSGNLIWEQDGNRNITVFELIPNTNGDGGYTVGSELDLTIIQTNFSYNNETRTLTFIFPDTTKGYRLSYLTDITGQPGTVSNTASLIGAEGDGTGTSESFVITEQHGSATMGRSGYVFVRKINNLSAILPGAEFTLYNTNTDGSIGSPRAVRLAGADGKIRIYGLQPGTYILRETNPPPGYLSLPHDFIVVVGSNYITTIDGQPMSLQDPIDVVNYIIVQDAGSLTIGKIVAGNGGNPSKQFAFTITFVGAPDVYPYIGDGVPSGTISSGDTIYLAHDQNITILNLPSGATYTVVEADYSADGYITTYTGSTGTIVGGEAQVSEFTNTREIGSLTISKTVAGNGGDPQKQFAFTVTFVGAPYTYPYVGSGGAGDGTITSGDTIYLGHGQSITINGLPKDATYTVVEADYSADGYITTYTGDTGTIVIDQTQTAAFTNTREIGSLTISKTVAGNGGDPQKQFAFTVTFVNAPYEYPYVGSGGAPDGTIESGDTIYLSHGQSITINGLPKDATYTVVEADYSADGYITTYTGDSGTIVVDQTQIAAFTNTREIGSLTISKTVAGNGGDPQKQFAFTVTFVNAPYTYPYVGSGGAPDGTIESGDTIYLYHGQSITINDLPKDATYTVVEADYSADGYITTYTGDAGTIIVDQTQIAAFTNTREIGSLTISKTVAGNGGDPQKQFAFTVTFVGAPYTYPYVGSGGAPDGTIESGDTIYLYHGQSITINDLPKDATYTVVEADYSADGYITTYTGDTGTIIVDQTQIAAFTNTREIGSLTISKTVAGNGGDPQKQFAFTVTFVGAPYTYPYVGSGGAPDGTIESGDTIYLYHGQSITINDLPKDATYTVVEADYSADGYITTYTGDTGTIIVDQTQIAAFTNTREIGSLTISKTVAGNGGDPTKVFTFTITFEGAPYTYPYVGSGGVADGTITSGDTINLTHGQSITINDLPKDATYTVVEADYSADGYIVTYTGDTGVIVVDDTVVAAFTNIREIGTLSISKSVTGNGGDPEKLFAFTVTFVNAPYTYPYIGYGGASDGTITSGDTIFLAHGQSITIHDLPKDAVYTVVEADYSAEGYITTYSGDTGTIVVDDARVALFTNTREIGSLTIRKTVAGNGGDLTKAFAFTVTFVNAPYTYPYVGSGGAANGIITSGDTIYLRHGQSITIQDLPKDAAYTVVEADYSADGYITTYTGNTGTIVVDDTRLAAFTNTRQLGSLTIKKTVAGDLADQNRYFTFMVEFETNEVYHYHGSKTGSIRSGQSVLLKHGEYIIIEGILVGTSYKVTELEANQGGYSTSYTGAVGSIDLQGVTAAFVNRRSSIPQTGDDGVARMGKIGLMISAPLLLVLSGLYGFLQTKKRKQPLK